MAANNMSNFHLSPGVFSTLMLLQHGKLCKLQQQILRGISRSSRPEMFFEKAVFKTYAKFTGKHQSRRLFLIKLQAWIENGRPATLLKRLQCRCFPVDFAKFLRTPILKNISKCISNTTTRHRI